MAGIKPNKNNFDKRSNFTPSTERKKNSSDAAKADALGIAGDNMLEPGGVIAFDRLPSEKVYQGSNNSWIILGRDRPGTELSGYGALGDDGAGSVDIVVGRMGPRPQSGVWAAPDFFQDAARIHISQKTDIDENFGLASGKVGHSFGRSAIGIKADSVRIIAREGIKLVTGTDFENSLGGVTDLKQGIDIIANNDETELQPMVKGDNLVFALNYIVDLIDETLSIMTSILKSQMEFNSKVSSHYHDITYFWSTPTSTSGTAIGAGATAMTTQMQEGISSLQFMKSNIANFYPQYLRDNPQLILNRENQLPSTTDKYILSKHNNVN
jgi:hypothetical protein